MKNVLLIGAGRFGRHIAMQLFQLGHQIMAVDTNEERINDVLPYVTNAQIGDSTNAEFLRSLGIGNFDVCIVTIGGGVSKAGEVIFEYVKPYYMQLFSEHRPALQGNAPVLDGVEHQAGVAKLQADWQAGAQDEQNENEVGQTI